MDSPNANQDQQNIQNPTPAQPVGGMNKELEAPVVSGHIEASEPELILHQEIKEIGAEVHKNEEPNLTPEDLSAGLVKRMPSVSTEPTQSISLPMDQKKAEEEVKKDKNVVNSGFWLANLVLKFFKKGSL